MELAAVVHVGGGRVGLGLGDFHSLHCDLISDLQNEFRS